jgi:uncharacterized protein
LVSLESVQDLGTIERLALRLPELVGSLLSIQSLADDLRVSFRTVDKWIEKLERLYAIFRVPPFGSPRIRAAKKMQKHYQFDWSLVEDPAARFENIVASHLLKWVNFLEDTEGREAELRYFRDREGREVDFVVTESRKPTLFVECKLSGSKSINPSLYYLKGKFPEVKAFQVHTGTESSYVSPEGIVVCSAVEMLQELI